MGRFYGIKIQNGNMTIDQVPSKWIAATEEWLENN